MKKSVCIAILASVFCSAASAQIIDGSAGIDNSSKKEKGKPVKDHKPSKPAKPDVKEKAPGHHK
ncbi:MAG TPA: hypothetical protein PKY99_08595 [Turneriella sp.]|nr:hypothetical protein [Turneriella sp.]HNL55918.1 hypothetical protein [Turneriella sp.]